MRVQHYTNAAGQVSTFVDTRDTHHSTPCRPSDIMVLDGPADSATRAEIAADIRRGQRHGT